MNLLVIPARGGSKRIPKKNIKNFKGKPIIEWAIKEAIRSNIFDKLIVSTDNEEIAEISKKAGADVPFLRPEELSDDLTSTSEVIIHAIEWFKLKGINFSNVCCLYPTAVFIKSFELIKALKELEASNKEFFIFSATTFPSAIQRALFVDQDGFSKMFNPDLKNTRSQDLVQAYHDAGQFYFASSKTWLKNTNIFDNGKPMILPRWRSQDIDTIEDWEMAEFIFTRLNK